MKICILSNSLAVHTQRWASAYAARGHDVTVLSIRDHSIPGVSVQSVCVGPVNSRALFWTLLSYVRLLFSCRRRLRSLAPDVVHAHYAITHGVIGAFSRFRPLVISAWGKDVIWDGRGNMPWYLQRFLRYAFARADLICSTSKFMRTEIEHLVPNGKPIAIVPFGVDCDVFRPRRALPFDRHANSHFRIGFVKSLSKKYGPVFLIRAMPDVLTEVPKAKLVMAGRGPMEKELKALVKELGIENHVEFAGFVPHANVPALMQTFDVLVNSSIYDSESFGVAILEAAACGVPAVVTDVGGVSEACIDGHTAILVQSHDSTVIAKAIVRLARNDCQRRIMGSQGRQFVQQNYVWSENVTRMLSCLHAVVSEYQEIENTGAVDCEPLRSPFVAETNPTPASLSSAGVDR